MRSKYTALMVNYSILLNIINGWVKCCHGSPLDLFYKHILGDSRQYMYAITVYCVVNNN